MPEYMYTINDPSSYPDLAWNEVIVSSGVYDVSLLAPLHHVEIGPQISGYNRMRITTKYLDMTSRKPASAYHGLLANKDYKVSSSNPALQSPRAPSLTSRVKTGGKSKDSYKPKKGVRCAPGFVRLKGMCVWDTPALRRMMAKQ